MAEPVWISLDLIMAIHDRQLAEHGGGSGVRDQGMLESAVYRPQQKFAYRGAGVDVVELAAAYTFGLARNHPFVDGNKRTAAVVCEVFLELNGGRLIASDEDLYPLFLGLAAGEVDETALVEWLRAHVRPAQVSESPPAYG